MKDAFLERRIGLETQFFVSHNHALLQKLKDEERINQIRNEMMAATGIHDDGTLDELINLELTAESLLALSLVPLIEVAWADGEISPEEKDAILKAASLKGIGENHPARQFLENWLHDCPSKELFHAWQSFIHSLSKNVGPITFEKLHAEISSFTKGVAESAGGFLGFGKVSAKEEEALRSIQKTFSDCYAEADTDSPLH